MTGRIYEEFGNQKQRFNLSEITKTRKHQYIFENAKTETKFYKKNGRKFLELRFIYLYSTSNHCSQNPNLVIDSLIIKLFTEIKNS